MTAQGRYAAPDSQFGRSAGNAAARGGALIAVAVVIGFLLLWQGGVGGSGDDVIAAPNDDDTTEQTDDQQSDEDSTEGGTEDGAVEGGTEDGAVEGGTEDGATDGGTDTGATDDTTDTTAPAPAVRAPNEVSVAVANGVGEAGLAGARESVLSTAGYVTAAVNAAAETAQSAVYYVEGYGEEAQAIAIELGGDASVLRPAPADPGALVGDPTAVEGFNVFVILGTDRVLG